MLIFLIMMKKSCNNEKIIIKYVIIYVKSFNN